MNKDHDLLVQILNSVSHLTGVVSELKGETRANLSAFSDDLRGLGDGFDKYKDDIEKKIDRNESMTKAKFESIEAEMKTTQVRNFWLITIFSAFASIALGSRAVDLWKFALSLLSNG